REGVFRERGLPFGCELAGAEAGPSNRLEPPSRWIEHVSTGRGGRAVVVAERARRKPEPREDRLRDQPGRAFAGHAADDLADDDALAVLVAEDGSRREMPGRRAQVIDEIAPAHRERARRH